VSLIDRIGNEAGRLGDRLDVDWLRYNPVVLRKFDTMAERDAPTVITAMRARFPDARRVIDVGAGSCAFAAEVRRQGLDPVAIERSSHGRRIGRAHGLDPLPFDLTHTPPAPVSGPFDLAYCFEVAEHVPPCLGEALVDFLCHLAPVIVFTAASPGQGGTGHINEQPRTYWEELFARRGFAAESFELPTERLSPHWATTNRFVLTRASAPASE
jgi:hypothetical protein